MRLVSPVVRSPAGQMSAGAGMEEHEDPFDGGRHLAVTGSWILRIAVAIALTLGIALRFFTHSALWLDEALTVDISRAPLHEIPSLLRHDGAPPLYYFMLHLWMGAFGTGDLAVRSLAGVIGVVTMPVTWLTAYRVASKPWDRAGDETGQAVRARASAVGARASAVAWAATLLFASSPFAVYYDTEARMYALVALLSALAALALTYLLERPSPFNAVSLALCTSALLYSHYWAVYIVAVGGCGLVYGAWRSRHRRECALGAAAVAAGVLSFLPWVPTLLFQLHHTGTPWAAPPDFTAIVFTFTQLAGGNSDAGRGLALVLGFLALLALTGSPLDRWSVSLDLRTRPGVRALAALSAVTVLVAIVAGKVTGSTFADRYTSVVAVLVLVVVAYGVSSLEDRRVRNGTVAVAVALGFAAAIPNAYISRTQAGEVATAITAGYHKGDVVAYCPDQLGPGVSRLLGTNLRQVTFPRGTGPTYVNWVDYDKVIARASPAGFSKMVLRLAGSTHTIWYVWAPSYAGFASDCQRIAVDLAAGRSQSTVVAETGSDTPFEIFEGEFLFRFSPR